MGHCKRKGHLVRYFIRSKKKMLSVHNPDAEEILDAGIIKSASRPAKPRPNAEEILDSGIIKPASRPAGSASPPPEGHGMSLMSLLGCEKKGVIHLNPSFHTPRFLSA